MSATVIAWLDACAETPGMPPCVASEPALEDSGEDFTAAEAEFTPTDLSETDPTQTDLAEAEVGGRSRAGS